MTRHPQPRATCPKRVTYMIRGLCADCGGERDSTRIHCEKCRNRRSQYRAKRYQRYAAQGICTKCERRKAEEGQIACAICRERQKGRYAEKCAQLGPNQCRRCTNQRDRDDRRFCAECRAESRRLRADRYKKLCADRICPRCYKNSAEDGFVVCVACRAKQVAKNQANVKAKAKRADERREKAAAEGREMRPYKILGPRQPKPRVKQIHVLDLLEEAIFATDPGWGREICKRVKHRISGKQFPDSLVAQWIGTEGRQAA